MAKKIALYVIIFLIALGAGFFAGKRNNGGTGELENRLVQLEQHNRVLALENRVARERLSAINGRISYARGIVADIGDGLDTAEGIIERSLRRVELIESALSVILYRAENLGGY